MKLVKTNNFSVYSIRRVRLELETTNGASQLFDIELVRPSMATEECVRVYLVQCNDRIAVLKQQGFDFRAKLTVTSSSGCVVATGDFDEISTVFEMNARLMC